MRKEKWAQHVCMRLLTVDSNMEEFAWREIYPFTDSLKIAFQPYDCLAAKVIQVCEIQNYRGAEKSKSRPGRKQVTATEDFEFHISYL